jgi:hypothetical protein|tara:strand:- start:2476 stop:2619 length:144 start_codon:yes stop_codon:yes gene_type:complete
MNGGFNPYSKSFSKKLFKIKSTKKRRVSTKGEGKNKKLKKTKTRRRR